MSKKILVIDDEKVLLDLLEDRLKIEGYDIITALDAGSGIDKAKGENPDLIILDIMLPDINGFDACAAIKRELQLNMPVIMMTGKVDAMDAVKASQHAADDFILKTPDWNDLIEAIKRYI